MVQGNRKQRLRESNPYHLHVASNSLTIRPQRWTCFDKLILLYQNHFLCYGRCLKLVKLYLS